ncbi:dTDP-4-dehydrorhamnose reductase [Pedobacter antarcticus]|uniref:dTDP-4-dehydrorhamnose reductase n=1 Tax=Pedobacter antarcticus TaxID=34086 RepID=UPI001C56E928|nr:dTDP-4-dehydrorhamnose reductase [Pedobacter antarcticus]
MNIIVVGGTGQLGQCLQEAIKTKKTDYNFIFLSSKDLNYTDQEQTAAIFRKYIPVFCLNCAAYTAVDLAEDEKEQAFAVNQYAVRNLAEQCNLYNTTLIHISTDFVFNGDCSVPLTEELPVNPVNVYGLSKLKGEQEIQGILEKHYIIRTSWLYSENAANFVKTMLNLAKNRDHLSVIYDQVGTPTYAMDLANIILKFIALEQPLYGLYHYSNEGVASWYDFAKAVFEFAEVDMKITPVSSAAFVTRAKRPHFSVLDKSKIKAALNIEIPYWRDSLNRCIQRI